VRTYIGRWAACRRSITAAVGARTAGTFAADEPTPANADEDQHRVHAARPAPTQAASLHEPRQIASALAGLSP
jgi:hypothetical protein